MPEKTEIKRQQVNNTKINFPTQLQTKLELIKLN